MLESTAEPTALSLEALPDVFRTQDSAAVPLARPSSSKAAPLLNSTIGTVYDAIILSALATSRDRALLLKADLEMEAFILDEA